MALSTTPIAGSLSRTGSAAWPLLFEGILVLVAIGALLPRFEALAVQETGRQGRFAEAIVIVRGLPDPVLPKLCASLGSSADVMVRDRLCGRTGAIPESERIERVPLALASEIARTKNEAMRALLRTAGWQWGAWALAGLLLLNLSRRRGLATFGVALALTTWAAAAWIGRVPWPLASGHSLVLGRESAYPLAMPADFVLWLLGAAIAVLLVTPWLRKIPASGSQNVASVLGYPGLVFATGIGWLLLLDLSANGQPGNRYLALYHQGHLWFGMLVFSVVAFVRQPLGRSLSWTLSLFDGLASSVGKRIGAAGGVALFLVSMLALVGAVGSLLPNSPQLTSELGRLWLVVGAAWFFFMRGTPFTERLVHSGSSLASLLRYVWPLLFVVIVLIGAMLITHDMGPLLIAAYAAGAFVAASVAMWLYQRLGTTGSAYALAIALFVAWILATTVGLFRFGSLDDVAAARLENLAAPLASANDQLALVTWFQRAAPPEGFGPGAVPWCGFGAPGTCAGVPAPSVTVKPPISRNALSRNAMLAPEPKRPASYGYRGLSRRFSFRS